MDGIEWYKDYGKMNRRSSEDRKPKTIKKGQIVEDYVYRAAAIALGVSTPILRIVLDPEAYLSIPDGPSCLRGVTGTPPPTPPLEAPNPPPEVIEADGGAEPEAK